MSLNGGVMGVENKPGSSVVTIPANVTTFTSSGTFTTGQGNPFPGTHKAHVLAVAGGGGAG